MSTSMKPLLLVEQKRLEAILNNKRKTVFWEERKKAHEETQKNLAHYTGKLQEQIMVPIGKRGLMKGKIVNTNQVFVSLGAGWFSKVCSAEAQAVCSRRINECKEMLDKLEKERKLFEGWTSLPGKQHIFATEDTKEIIEPFDEKEEESWREKHADKVKEHRKKLAEVRHELEENRGKEKSEEELWRHLDLLELQEEFEDELERLGEQEQSDSDESTSLDSDDDTEEEDPEEDAIVSRNTITNSLRTSAGLQESNNSNIMTKSIIQVKKNNVNETNKNIRTVKKVTFQNLPELSKNNHPAVSEKIVEQMKTVAIGEVVERTVLPSDCQESSLGNRPVSKFKSSKRTNKTS